MTIAGNPSIKRLFQVYVHFHFCKFSNKPIIKTNKEKQKLTK